MILFGNAMFAVVLVRFLAERGCCRFSDIFLSRDVTVLQQASWINRESRQWWAVVDSGTTRKTFD